MAVTRIKNNQITDSTITYAKIASGTLVGSNFNANLTLNSNVSIIGNLSVTGTTSTVSSTNTYVNDPLVVFNNGYTGSLSGYDIGILVNRNLAALSGYGSVNTAWVWVEADSAFEAIVTTDTGGGITSINNSGFANIKVGNITAQSATVTTVNATTLNGNFVGTVNATTINASGVVTLTAGVQSSGLGTGTLVINNGGGASIAGNLYVGGNTNIVAGNVTFNNSAFFVGNTTTGFGAMYAGIPSGYSILPQVVGQFSENYNGYAQINSQNINAGADATTDYVATANNGSDSAFYIDMGINGSGYDPTSPTNSLGTSTYANDGYLYVQGSTGAPGAGGNLVIGTTSTGKVVRFIAGGHDAEPRLERLAARRRQRSRHGEAPDRRRAVDPPRAGARPVLGERGPRDRRAVPGPGGRPVGDGRVRVGPGGQRPRVEHLCRPARAGRPGRAGRPRGRPGRVREQREPGCSPAPGDDFLGAAAVVRGDREGPVHEDAGERWGDPDRAAAHEVHHGVRRDRGVPGPARGACRAAGRRLDGP